MEKYRVWVDFDPEVVDVSTLERRFGSDDRFEYVAKRVEDHEECVRMGGTCDFVINTYDALGPEEFRRFKKAGVRMVIHYGTGYDKINVRAATENGIPFANTPGANACPVAELALLHMLNCARSFVKSNRGIAPGLFPHYSGFEITGKTIGLVGFGNVARTLTELLSGFHVRVKAYDIFFSDVARKFAREHGVELVSSNEELFETCDIVSLHIPATKETEKSIGKSLLDRAKKGLVLVNTCRGKVVNEKDLADAVRSGKIAAAGLDVLCEEPPREDCPLLGLDNVYISGHLGGSSAEAEIRTQNMIYDTVSAFLRGELAFNVVNKNEIKRS